MGEKVNLGFVTDEGATITGDSHRKEEEKPGEGSDIGLQRNLGLFSGVSLIVGTVVEVSLKMINKSCDPQYDIYVCRNHSGVRDLGDSWVHHALL